MGLLDLFKKKARPKVETVKSTGDVCAEAGYKPLFTVQVFAGVDSQYLYIIRNQFVMYEIGKYNTSHIHTYETEELARQEMLGYLEHNKKQGFTHISHLENSMHNALINVGL